MDSNMIYILFICIFVPIMVSVPLIEKSSRDITIYILIGIVAALFISEVNGMMLKLFDNDILYVTTTITPVTEEIIKAFPVLFYVFLFPASRRKLLSISFALGIGFALFENTYILISNVESVSLGWALIRGFSTALMHGLCTAAVGYGMAYVRLKKKLALPGTFSLLITAIIYHGVFNIFVQTESMKYFGFLLPSVTYMPFLIYIIIKNKKTKTEVEGKSISLVTKK